MVLRSARVAVAGGSGFLGSSILAALGPTGAGMAPLRIHPAPIDHSRPPAEVVDRLLAAWRVVEGRVFDDLVSQLHGFDAVVNAAGLARPGCRDDAALWAANAVVPAALAIAAATAGVPRLVHVSSAAVQGRRPVLDESPALDPETPYARSKAAGESALLSGQGLGPVEIVIYRPASVMGYDRNVTRHLTLAGRLPVLPVGAHNVTVPVALVENVAAAAAFLATHDGPIPAIVAHSSEELSIQDLMERLAGRRHRFLRVPAAAQMARAAARIPAAAARARQTELFLIGQRQATSSLDGLGFEPPLGPDEYCRIGARLRAGGHRGGTLARIVFLLTRSDAIGGAAIHVTDLAAALGLAGHDVTVLVGGTGVLVDRMRLRGIKVRPLDALVRTIQPAQDIRGARELASVLRELRPDIVSTHSSKAGLLGRFVARWLRIPVLFTAHGWAFTDGVSVARRASYSVLEALAGPFSQKVVCVSDYDNMLARRMRIAEGRRVVIKNGVRDVPVPLLADPMRQPANVVMVARFDEQKDHETLFRAFATVGPRVGATLTLVGDGPRLEAMVALAAGLGLNEEVRFLGLRHDVHRILAGAQIFALVSRWEGLPRSILEAMRAGLPVIASDVGGVRELVDSTIGELVPREDIDALAAAFERLLCNPALRGRLGSAARKGYEDHHTLGRLADETIGVYEEILGRTLARPPAEALVVGDDE